MGLQVSEGRSFFFTCLPVGCTTEKLCPSQEEPGCLVATPAAPSTGPAVRSSSAQALWANWKDGPTCGHRNGLQRAKVGAQG